jgi:hypothetical protein
LYTVFCQYGNLLKVFIRKSKKTGRYVIYNGPTRWAGHVVHMEEGRGVHRVMVGKPEEKKPLGRPRHRWEDNIKRDLQEVGGDCGDWMERAQDRDRWLTLVNTVMNFWVHKCGEFLD